MIIAPRNATEVARVMSLVASLLGIFEGLALVRSGASYAGFKIETSIAEVAFHKRRILQDGRVQSRRAFDYIDFIADFSGDLPMFACRDMASSHP